MIQASKEKIEEKEPGIGPWIMLICLLLFLDALQGAFITRFIVMAGNSGDVPWQLRELMRIDLPFALAAMALGFLSMGALLATRSRFGVLFAAAGLVLCQPILPALRLWIEAGRHLRPENVELSYLTGTSVLLSVVSAGYLLVSKRVEAVYGLRTREPVLAFWAKLKRGIRNR